jgi:hypothetical protein
MENENKWKEVSPTCQGAPKFVECTLKSLQKAFETRMLKISHHLKFSEASEIIAFH